MGEVRALLSATSIRWRGLQLYGRTGETDFRTTWTRPGCGKDRRDEADTGAGVSGLGSGVKSLLQTRAGASGGKEGISVPSCEAPGFSGVLQSSS